ncbi:MAG: zeta toxin [Leptospiraceae bacterium]|nr:zeta toxin [Leptospiraceae bacterium]
MNSYSIKKKRLRIFAGPNGSGKSTFIEKFPIGQNIKLGIYINADEIENSIYENGFLDLEKFHIPIDTNEIQAHFKESQFSPNRLNDKFLFRKFRVTDGKLFYENSNLRNSYVSSDIAEFFRTKLVNMELDFLFETVMSDISKIHYLETAELNGFHNYLYFFCTDDVEININRVAIRVEQNGHSVDPDKIRNRYYKSLGNLKNALRHTYRAYFFDNSGETSQLIAEYFNNQISVISDQNTPNWFINYVYK